MRTMDQLAIGIAILIFIGAFSWAGYKLYTRY